MKTILIIALVSTSVNICAQDAGKTNPSSPTQDRTPQIQSEKMVLIPLELSGLLLNPYRCDGDENIYYRRVGLDDGLRDPIKRVDIRGELKATYDIQQAGSDFYAVDYFVSAEGEVSALGWNQGGRWVTGIAVATFGKDGNFKSATKLQTPMVEGHAGGDRVVYPGIAPHTIGVFQDGSFLVTGLSTPTAKDKLPDGTPIRHPFTAVFKSDGSLAGEVRIRDDKQIEEAIKKGDHSLIPDGSREEAFTSGSILAGIDGNLYLWRKTSPLILYAVSPSGEIVRTVKVNAPQAGMMPDAVASHGGNLAVLFVSGLNGPKQIVVADQQTGETRHTYDVENSLGVALTCYSPPDFIFLGSDRGRMSLRTATAR
jgi:hypothetical protein